MTPDQSTVRSLVLAGGGMRVAYQAGAIRALAEQGLRFRFSSLPVCRDRAS